MAVQGASAELRAGGDGVVQHEKVQLFLALFLVDGGEKHTVALKAHHLPGRQIHNGHQRLAHQLLRLIELMNAGENLTVRAGTVIQREAQELFRLLHRFAGFDLDSAEVRLAECVEVHLFRELRLHLHGGQRGLAGSGYQGIETPTFEFFDVFSREVGTVSSRELYKFFDKEGNTLVLRPDMTPSIARAVSKYFHDETPIRLCYMGNTFINYDKYQGRLKETTQMGAELMGDGSVASDVELLSVLIEALQEAGLREFQVSVGQVEFFKALLREAGIGNAAEESLRRLISDKNRFGAEELLAQAEAFRAEL